MAQNNEHSDLEKQMLLLQEREEEHFSSREVVHDIIIGISDGLTVPFALAAGLSGADVSSSIILIARIAEGMAGSISMGLGGYLAAKSEADHYARELTREQEEVMSVPNLEAAEVAEILAQYGAETHEYEPIVNALRRNPEARVDFIMKFELGLEKPDPMRALWSALPMALSYIGGGTVPLMRYIFMPLANQAVVASLVITLMALLIFGYETGHFTGNQPFKSALQTALAGAIASGAAYSVAKAFNQM